MDTMNLGCLGVGEDEAVGVAIDNDNKRTLSGVLKRLTGVLDRRGQVDQSI